ncbi:MAG: hypothetical protein RR692_02720 [Raoultibacter sp.]
MSFDRLQQKRFAVLALVVLLIFTALTGASGCSSFSSENSGDVLSTEGAVIPAKEQPYRFASQEKFDQHYKKHGREFGEISQDEYLQKANDLIASTSSTVKTKREKDDGDTCYYDTATNEFLVLNKKGVIRTFFRPNDGIDYFNRQ